MNACGSHSSAPCGPGDRGERRVVADAAPPVAAVAEVAFEAVDEGVPRVRVAVAFVPLGEFVRPVEVAVEQ